MTTALRTHRRDGFALLAVLWLVVAISAIALEFSLQAHAQRTTAINVVERGQAYAAAAGGIETTRARLAQLIRNAGVSNEGTGGGAVDPNDPWRWVDSLYSGTDTLGASAYQMTVRDGGRYLNVNRMSANSWRTLLTALNVDYDVSDRLSQSILDWRDPDTTARTRGAERGEYLHEHRLVLPTNRNFARVDELRDVMGMTPELYTLIRPYVAMGVSGKINVNTAPLPVLRTLPGFSDEVVGAILDLRSTGQWIQSLPQLQGELSGPARASLMRRLPLLMNMLTFSTTEVLVTSVGWAPGRHTHVTSSALLTRGQQDINITWREDE